MPNSFDPLADSKSTPTLPIAALAIAIIALCVSFFHFTLHPLQNSNEEKSVDNHWARIQSSRVLRAGYGGYPPYTIINLKESDPTKRLSGFAVDLVDEIASRNVPPLKVEWRQFSFDSMKADLDRDQFDFIADPIFETIPRAYDFSFSEPYSYFGIAAGLVRVTDNRFKTFEDLDRPGITIALAEGWTSSEYARASLHKPTFKSIPVTGDAFNQLDEVIFGRADVALNDVPTILQYVRAHKGRVKALWLDHPPSSVAGAFLVRSSDFKLQEFLDTGIRVLQADGTITRLDKKWKSLGFFPVLNLRPGSGLEGNTAASMAGSR